MTIQSLARWLVTNRTDALGCAFWYFGGLFVAYHWPLWIALVGFAVYLAASLICVLVAGAEERRA